MASRRTLLLSTLGLYALNHLFSLARFHRLPAYHTWAGKAAAVLMAAGMLTWFATGATWLFTVAMAGAIISATEQLTISALLPGWAADVPTCFHAWQRRHTSPPGPPQVPAG